MHQQKIKIAIIAGEDSGDLLGADLIENLLTLNPNIEFIGVGGNKMEAAGLQLISANTEFAIMGFAEVISKLPKLLILRRRIIKEIIAAKPDLFIGIDAPDLNFPIGKKLKNQGIKIIHYVSPSIWAWRPKRAVKISKLTDLVLTLFPFEPKYYQEVGGTALFVGHPMAQNIGLIIDKDQVKKSIGLDTGKPVLAVLPGSRSNELKAHTDIFLKTALKLKAHNSDLQIISANTSRQKMQFIQESANRNNLEIKIIQDATTVLQASDLALLASGTVALEAMLCKTPMVVGYRISAITYSIVKTFKMLLLPYYSLPNILYGGFLVPEVLQNNMTVDNLYQQLYPLLQPTEQTELVNEFTRLHQDLLSPDTSAAKAVMEFLKC
ncbi:Lipid-A-disaccharide synthase [hydrothermal vent metagenome]|uniref:lipid-A-disaccharide synthase n=1 Tax=hydrothermal vent metagenome TaxID=652676 RepID=A0A3B0VCE1_9ZZZZ